MSKKNQTYSPCDDCPHSYSKNGQESGMCKICEFTYFINCKQSEWISVVKRKPTESGKYLVCTQRGNVYQTKYYVYPENKGGHWGARDKGRSITHWMPLPEAPNHGRDKK